MATEGNIIDRRIFLNMVIIISIFAFFGGAVGGILFCGHYAHEPLGSSSGSMAALSDNLQIERLETVAEKNPTKPDVWIRLGDLYADSGQYEKAMAAYGRYLQRDPRNADVWVDLGMLHRITDRPEEAITSFDRAIAEDPKNESARLYKAIVLREDFNDREGAIKVLEKLQEINPSAMAWLDQSVSELAQQYRNGEPAGAE